MKTQGEIEAAIGEWFVKFEHETKGRGPSYNHSFLLGDLIVVRLKGLLSPTEQQFATTKKGRNLLKQARIHSLETARPLIDAMVLDITGTRLVSFHHDFSTITGEAVIALTLTKPPSLRHPKKDKHQ